MARIAGIYDLRHIAPRGSRGWLAPGQGGQPVRVASKLVLPIRWTASGVSGLFPALEADLEVAPLGPDRTQLAMSARYEPPFGPIGRAIDRAVLFRVAEATLKDFLDRVANALVEGAEPAVPSEATVSTDVAATSD